MSFAPPVVGAFVNFQSMMAEADVLRRLRNICNNTRPRAALKALRRITIPPRFRAVSYVLITRIDYKATVSELDALQVTLARSDLEVAWQGNEKEVVMSRLHKLRAAAAAAEQNGMAMRRCVSPFISSRRPL